MQTERRVAANPQTKAIDLGCGCYHPHPPSRYHHCYYYSARKLVLIFTVPRRVEDRVDIGTAVKCAARAQGCISQRLSRYTQPTGVAGLATAALQPCSRTSEAKHRLIWRYAEFCVLNHFITTKLDCMCNFLLPNFQVHRHFY